VSVSRPTLGSRCVDRRASAFASSCAFALAITGCYASTRPMDGGSSDASGPPADARADGSEPLVICDPIDLAGLMECERLRECELEGVLCESGKTFLTSPAPPRAWCLAGLPIYEWRRAELEDATTAGRVVLDPDAARACFAWHPERCLFHPIPFLGPDVLPEACGRVLRGRVADGGRCGQSEECEGGVWASWCDRTSTCPGTCRPLPGLGEECRFAIGCRGALLCDHVVCVEGTEGTPCRSDEGCNWPLHCRDGSCGPPPREGEACEYALGCDVGLYCVSGTCAAPLGRADACGAERPCADGLRCASGRCVLIVLPGEECGDGIVCPRGYACDLGRCARLPVVGEACDDRTRPCVEGRCEVGACGRVAEGAVCDPASPLGECEEGGCGPDRTCVPLPVPTPCE
jgi:hypothetical protein